jgi:hypothetical protein
MAEILFTQTTVWAVFIIVFLHRFLHRFVRVTSYFLRLLDHFRHGADNSDVQNRGEDAAVRHHR